ncbi:MAG: hypothetical protein ACP5N2_04445 [Candidatus Nanoarchaeia archaeon]
MRSESIRKEKRMKRNNIIIGGILLLLMVFSMLAVAVIDPQTQSELSYNGYEFSVIDSEGGQMVLTKVNNQEYSFYTMPLDAKRIIENVTGIDVISSSSTLIFAKEPLGLGNSASSEQLYYSLLIYDLKVASEKTILSGLSAQDDYSNEKVYTCDDASEFTPVIMMKKGIYTSLNIDVIEPNCFELSSDPLNILILRDYLLYKSLGIIV